MSIMNIALTNLGKYNEGELVYTWLELPATEEDIEAALKKIGVSNEPDERGRYYEEYFISDYECSFYKIGEYENLTALNEIAEQLEALDEEQLKVMEALSNDYDWEEALEIVKNYNYTYWDARDMGEVAYMCYENQAGNLGPLENYIDWDALGRDIELEGNFYEVAGGILEVYR